MQSEIKVPSSSYEDSFAGLLAEFAAPLKKIPPTSDLCGLDDDVVSLSYEQALRSQASFRPEPSPIEAGRPPARLAPESSIHTHARNAKAPADACAISCDTCASVPPARRSSSVTIRLSAPESERLHLRASEAGLTVSAYLRSCAFEVESLRTEVKCTLATLRSENAPTETKRDESPQIRQSAWWRLFARCGLTRIARGKPGL
jgi:hypothetical protein